MSDTRNEIWISPDNRIKKEILITGVAGSKPTENSICNIEITSANFEPSNIVSEYISFENPVNIKIGDSNTAIDREIDKCLQTMYKDETSSVILNLLDKEFRFVLKLCHFEFTGYIYEWNAKEKCLMAQSHKEKGIELFRANRFKDASHRFSRGLKLVLSIPVPVDEILDEIDGIKLEEIDKIKANLYNNLASCYNKEKQYNTVIELCNQVLEIEEENMKALYKRGFAYAEIRDFDKASIDLMKICSTDVENKAAQVKLQFVQLQINQQEANFNSMVKKMFRNN